jgi:hypothetical protein
MGTVGSVGRLRSAGWCKEVDSVVHVGGGGDMASEQLRGKAFNETTQGFVDTGHSPHYTELASALGVSPDEAREAQHEAVDHSLSCWFAPETDSIASWAPFSNIPNHHRITIRGEQKWFGQCGVEVLLAPRMFPGEEATIETRCPTSGTPITVRIKGGEILDLGPPTAVVLINHPFDRITTPFNEGEVSAAYACNDMHIFRSDEDGRAWSRFDPEAGQLLPVGAIVALGGHPFVSDRRRTDYYPRQEALFNDLMVSMQQ